jgi:hypothetical protein
MPGANRVRDRSKPPRRQAEKPAFFALCKGPAKMVDIKRTASGQGAFASEWVDAQEVATENTFQAPGAKNTSVI